MTKWKKETTNQRIGRRKNREEGTAKTSGEERKERQKVNRDILPLFLYSPCLSASVACKRQPRGENAWRHGKNALSLCLVWSKNQGMFPVP